MLNKIIVSDGYFPCKDDCKNSEYGYSDGELSGCYWACRFLTIENLSVSGCKESCQSRGENGLSGSHERNSCAGTCSRKCMNLKFYVFILCSIQFHVYYVSIYFHQILNIFIITHTCALQPLQQCNNQQQIPLLLHPRQSHQQKQLHPLLQVRNNK